MSISAVKRRHIVAILVVCVMAVAAAITTIAFGWQIIARVNAVKASWLTYSVDVSELTRALDDVQIEIGYGHMIHNFKNYVLRREVAYEVAVARDFEALSVSLARLESHLSPSPENQAAVSALKEIIGAYRARFEETRARPAQQQLSAEALDEIVRIDDRQALAALRTLSAKTMASAERMRTQTESAIESTIGFIRYGLILGPVSLAIGAIILWYMRQLVIANRRAEAARGEVEQLIANAPDAMLCVDGNGRIVQTNREAEHLLGYSRSELLDLNVDELVPEYAKGTHEALRDAYLAAPPVTRPMGSGGELVALRKDGREVPVEISLSRTEFGSRAVVTVIVRDVSARLASQRAIMRAREAAERSLERLQQAQRSLVEAEKLAALGGLVAGVAHEINTPVGVVLSSATYLEQETRALEAMFEAETLEVADFRAYLQAARQASQLIHANAVRAADLIRSFKEVAVDQASGERRPFDLRAYLDEVLLSLNPQLRTRAIDITVEGPDALMLDSFPGAISHVITNLVVNSLAHAFPGDRPGRISIHCAAHGSDHVRLIYRDDGIGIPEHLHGKVFEPFFTTRRNDGGSGLGLNIVYNTVNKVLGGTLELASRRGAGVVFTLTLPCRAPSVADGPDAADEPLMSEHEGVRA